MDTKKLKSTISKILRGPVERDINSAIDTASQPPVEADAEKAGICPKCNKPFSSMVFCECTGKRIVNFGG